MFKKFTVAISAFALVTMPAFGQERTFVTNPPTTSGSGVSYNSGTNTVTATAADGARLYSITRPIEEGAKYKYEFTIGGYTAGGVRPYVGTIRESSVAPTIAATVTASTNPLNAGVTPIADNFTTDLGLVNGAVPAPVGNPAAPTNDNVGAFRFWCSTSKLESIDPLVVYGKPGGSHLHNFFGNTGVNAFSTYKSLRTTGSTTCQSTDARFPINRSAYWFPAMLNGRGGVVTAGGINVYYKRFPAASPYCNEAAPEFVGKCVTTPNGIRMIWGYDMATMTPQTGAGAASWTCRDKNALELTGRHATLQALRNAGPCPLGVGNRIVVSTQAPDCWNGTQTGTANHRSHVAYPRFGIDGKCPTTHPFIMPFISHQIHWDVDANLANWRLSSDDQMGMGVVAGETFHTDFMEAWSPSYKAQWTQSCINEYRSCSIGENGQGKFFGGRASEKSRDIPMTRVGLGLTRRKNGTFTGEFTAPASGEFGLNFLLFTGNVTGFKVTKITKGARGPVTQPVTQ